MARKKRLDVNFWALKKNGKQDFDKEYLAVVVLDPEGPWVESITNLKGKAVPKSKFEDLADDMWSSMGEQISETYYL